MNDGAEVPAGHPPAAQAAAGQPKVSVLVLAYNHEAFLAQALESALAQRTGFHYEIVVGDDCSTDGTRDILLAYRERFPERIRPLLPESNLGMMGNLMATFQACRGEYVAILEGDDYWTSPDKLQRQVDYLDSHPEYAECFHNAEIVVEGRPEENRPVLDEGTKATYTLGDLVSANFIPTCSVMLRARLLPVFPRWFAELPMGDWPLHILLAEKGALGYLPHSMAAYRVHGGGAWSGSSRLANIEKSVLAARVLNRHLGFRFDLEMRHSMFMWRREAAMMLLDQGSHLKALIQAWKAAIIGPQLQGRFFLMIARRSLKGALRAAFRRQPWKPRPPRGDG